MALPSSDLTEGTSMTHATTEFFDDLARAATSRCWRKQPHRASRPLARLAHGRWLVTVKKGDMTVSHTNAKADCVIRMDQALFEQIVAGRETQLQPCCGGCSLSKATRSCSCSFERLFQAADGRSGRERTRSDPRRQHLRGSDSRGDIEASLTDPTGLFSFDSRFLSTMDPDRGRRAAESALGRRSAVLRIAFFLVPGTGTVYVDAKPPSSAGARSATGSMRSSRS